MPNTILTPSMVTREALRVLHQKLNFVGNVVRDYDDSFAKKGAKIGDTIKVRLPNQYQVRTGAALSPQDTTESSVSLQISTQKGVDLNFTSSELTLSLDDFSDRILQPAMSVLAATIEADALSMALDVYQVVNNIGSAITLKNVLTGRKALQDALTPADGNRTCLLNTQDNVDLIDALKGLFQDSTAISKQYKEGIMGRTAGFDFYENTLLANQATGTAASATTYTVNGASQVGSGVVVATGATTFKKGDVITFAGCNRVHPETKADTGVLQQFVVTADYAGGAGTIAVSPAIVTSGGAQNVSASPTNGGAVTKVGGASAIYKPSMVFHKEAFAFATADLLMPQGVHFAAREVMDGVSMRIVQQYDINNDKFPCRLDVLYGYKTLRAQLAARILSN
ncbi:P22 phage major capsid protein family protein [Dechloromonas sp. ARDL1]|uniref:P22 phage major capsid protein family protein n=1 Tax=Dechloromonas sp. ARDL1 TaxID=3322121 RepID=UPI003DA75CCB